MLWQIKKDACGASVLQVSFFICAGFRLARIPASPQRYN